MEEGISTELMAIQAEAQTNYKPSIKDFSREEVQNLRIYSR